MNEMLKFNRTKTDDKLNEYIDCFAQLHKHEHFNEMKMGRRDRELRTIQPPRQTNAEHTEAVRQSSNRTKEKQEHNKKFIIKKIII